MTDKIQILIVQTNDKETPFIQSLRNKIDKNFFDVHWHFYDNRFFQGNELLENIKLDLDFYDGVISFREIFKEIIPEKKNLSGFGNNQYFKNYFVEGILKQVDNFKNENILFVGDSKELREGILLKGNKDMAFCQNISNSFPFFCQAAKFIITEKKLNCYSLSDKIILDINGVCVNTENRFVVSPQDNYIEALLDNLDILKEMVKETCHRNGQCSIYCEKYQKGCKF